MTAIDYFGIIGGSVGIVSGLFTAISKKKVDSVTIAQKVEEIYGDIIHTLQDEVKGLKKKLEDLSKEKENVRCDKIDCPNRIPPKK